MLQTDIAVSYSCEYQNEIQSALWSHESVMLFTAAMAYKAECKTFLIVSDSRDKGKGTVAVFIDFLYNHFGATDAMEDIIWSDGPTSEFKNKYMVKFLQSLSQNIISNSRGSTLLPVITKALLMLVEEPNL